MISISKLYKTYEGGFEALCDVNLEIPKGEVFALLGPNGAGKTTLIGAICGLVNITSGSVKVDGEDVIQNPRSTKSIIGLVPQEIALTAFESVWDTVCFSRGLFGKAPDPQYIESLLKSLSLWDKRKNKIMTLSGGMKRRLMIAKALSHGPKVLFLDEPSAGVDVELRKGMWEQVSKLRESGVTVILTTHYIDEAEQLADRIGIINKGKLILTERKQSLMQKLGKKQMHLTLGQTIVSLPAGLESEPIEILGDKLVYSYESRTRETGIAQILEKLTRAGIDVRDIETKQSSLEDIFVELVKR